MKYIVELSAEAKKDLKVWKKTGQKKIQKRIEQILRELQETPTIGIGKPKPLKGGNSEIWSRKIDSKNRIVYTIQEKLISVFVVSAMGHYQDK